MRLIPLTALNMKKVLLLIFTTLLPIISSKAYVDIDGIYYNLDSQKLTAEVIYGPSHWDFEHASQVETLFDVKSADDLALMNGYKQILGIDKLYEFHNDIVLDVIYRKLIELTAQYTYYHKGISIEESFLDRYITAIYGYEPDPRNDRN